MALTENEVNRLANAIAARITAEQVSGDPIANLNRYSGNDTDWQTLVTWTVSSGKVGDLHEISVTSDNDAKTRFKLTIAGTDMAIPDEEISTPFTLTWRRNEIAAAAVVIMQVKSSDGTTIAVDGILTGTERDA